jgi:4-deoxy-L-threo-5-hexosulose-uronate ketol-isomerase
METRYLADPERFEWMNTIEVRDRFLVETLFEEGSVELVYCDSDRAVVGSAVPLGEPLALSAGKELASDYFAERREVGAINVGGAGGITVDGQKYDMDNRDGLYIGRGAKEISFESANPEEPAAFYILSYPAHKEYPTTHIKIADAEPVRLGSQAESNERTIYKYIHPAGVPSCQLVMGLTELEDGCVWNTMPAHTHARRTEVYMYFDVPDNSVVFHFMGKPDETRHIVVRNRQVVLSTSWSIHAGAGTTNYKFIWGMGGENQAFGDMDAIDINVLR